MAARGMRWRGVCAGQGARAGAEAGSYFPQAESGSSMMIHRASCSIICSIMKLHVCDAGASARLTRRSGGSLLPTHSMALLMQS